MLANPVSKGAALLNMKITPALDAIKAVESQKTCVVVFIFGVFFAVPYSLLYHKKATKH